VKPPAWLVAWRLVRATAHALQGWLTITFTFPRLSEEQREMRVQVWARGMLKVLGIELRLQGQPPLCGPVLLVANHISWLDSGHRLNFRGIALTGWSRYDHFSVLCELLPAALPSLILNLAILTRGGHDFESVKRAHRILQCGSQKALMTSEELRRNPMQW